jgi:nucleoside-diphosphate-sugar epimerase
MANPILVTGAAGRVGAVGRTVTELLLKQGKAVRAMASDKARTSQNPVSCQLPSADTPS